MSSEDVLPDIVGPGLRVLFVGTAVGSRSAETGHYYSGPGNSFYRDLCRSGFTDRELSPEEDWRLPQYGIGLTDVCKRVATSDDRTLEEADLDRERLTKLVEQEQPRVVCFNGKKAYLVWRGSADFRWGLQPGEGIAGVPIFVVPQTSGRVLADQPFGGRTRLGWFVELRRWLDGSAVLAAPSPVLDSSPSPYQRTTNTQRLAQEIISRFQSEGTAPYSSGRGELTFGRIVGQDIIVYRRDGNPEPWKVPIPALEECVERSCTLGRWLRAGECNEVCNHHGSLLAALIRLLPVERYQHREQA